MQITVAELAKLLNGELVGNPDTIISKVAKIEEGNLHALSFLSNPKYEQYIYTTKSSAVLVNKNFIPASPVNTVLIMVDDAYASFTFLLEKFGNTASQKVGIDVQAIVSKTAKIGKDVWIGGLSYIENEVSIGQNTKIYPQVYIGENSTIGDNCIILPGVKIYDQCVIGNNCIIHAGSVIGSDGFGFAPLPDRSYKKIPQTGNVIIEDDVEIGSNCSVDRATMGSTIIRKGVKLDNLVQIAHNVEIGEHTVIASQSGVAGSSKVGKYCIIAGQVGIVGHLTVADGSIIGGQSGVNSNIKQANQKWFGSPAFEYVDALKSHVHFKLLPSLEKRVRELEQQLKNINQDQTKNEL
ncbi:MAG: UDP-3-O-(3-hydroxymyristoyl)glucosamine N-acyltransferase [Bacteroidota bacterium]